MFTFIHLADLMMVLLIESVHNFEEIWIEYLGGFAHYRMAIKEAGLHDREGLA